MEGIRKENRRYGSPHVQVPILTDALSQEKVSEDTEERYTMAKDRTEAVGNQARSHNAINAKELAKFNKAK